MLFRSWGARPATRAAVDARGDDAVDEQAVLGPVTADHGFPLALVLISPKRPRPFRRQLIASLPVRFSHDATVSNSVLIHLRILASEIGHGGTTDAQGRLTVRRCNRGSSRVVRVALTCPSQCGHVLLRPDDRVRDEKVTT